MDTPSTRNRVAIGASRQQSVALKYDVHVVLAFTIIGILLILILGKSGGGLWGYGVIGFALFGLLVFEMAYRTNIRKGAGFRVIFDVLVHSGPIILLIICVSWLLALNVMYKPTIESGHLPGEYDNFQVLGMIILLVELYLLYKYLTDQGKIKFGGKDIASQLNELMSKNLSWLMILLSVIYMIVIGIMQVILQYFTTDG